MEGESSESLPQSGDLPAEVIEVFEKPVLAYLATNGPDGHPHVSPMWVDVEDGLVTVNTAEGRVKYRNLKRDARVSISAEDPAAPFTPAVVKGVATMTTEGADEHIDRLAKKYLGHDRYQFRQPGEVRVKIVINHIAAVR
jgi:PPOX class probable F420-dependent enzyme